MGFPPFEREKGIKQALKIQELSPDTLRLNFYEPVTPLNKKIFTLVPQYDMGIHKISYNFGSLDLSVNGYIQLIISKIDNPNVYSVSEANSLIILDRMGGSNDYTDKTEHFFDDVFLKKYEEVYIRIISNIPNGSGIVGKINFYFRTLYQ